ncbi:hypothetical protein NRS6120_05330 [Bacillus subtilis]|nr:hypothetical protein [Bacillus subtilis]CAF1791671.1 hypothetical protein NRS6120_03992 [Bacillus subtilis]CAI6243175.1 hypothetical protein NRS6120_05330 [Bacillus subtilis]
MYHIKDNARIKESAALIVDGLFRCLEKKDFVELTITEVHKEATVGRATFYRLFDNLTDVLAYQSDLMFQNLFEDMTWQENTDYKGNFMHFISYWMEQRILLAAIINSNHLEILYGSHKRCALTITESITNSRNGMTETQNAYFRCIQSSVMIGVLLMWFQRGQKETAEELFEIAEKSTLHYSV